MIEVRQTVEYVRWFAKLRDTTARARIDIRIRRLTQGNFGDTKSVGDGLFELRIDYGPGYRVYFIRRGEMLVVLLAGGDKDSQERDIAKARDVAKSLVQWTDLGDI